MLRAAMRILGEIGPKPARAELGEAEKLYLQVLCEGYGEDYTTAEAQVREALMQLTRKERGATRRRRSQARGRRSGAA